MEAAAAGGTIDRSALMVVGAMSIALVVITLDLSALNVAIPAMERAFHSDIGTMQWALNGYALSFGVLLVTAGRLADVLGRRRIFFIGTALFAFTALLGGFAPGEWWMIAARVGMGVGAALMLPSATGIVYAALPAARAGLGGAVVVGSFGIGQAIGPLIGGALTTYLSWRWVFFVDVPAAGLAYLATWLSAKKDRPTAASHQIDYEGSALLTGCLIALLFALDQATDWGWGDPRVLSAFGLSVAALGGFVLAERRIGERALIPPDIVANRRFAAIGLAVLLASPVFFSSIFYLPQFMDRLSGFDAIHVGAGMLPFMVALTIFSFVAGKVYDRMGARRTLALGLALVVAGCASLGFVQSGSYGQLVPGMALLGTGLAFFASTGTTAAVTAVAARERSLAGGIAFTFRVGGGAIGLGLMTAIVSTSGSGFLDGFRTGFLVNGGFALAALLVTLLFVRRE